MTKVNALINVKNSIWALDELKLLLKDNLSLLVFHGTHSSLPSSDPYRVSFLSSCSVHSFVFLLHLVQNKSWHWRSYGSGSIYIHTCPCQSHWCLLWCGLRDVLPWRTKWMEMPIYGIDLKLKKLLKPQHWSQEDCGCSWYLWNTFFIWTFEYMFPGSFRSWNKKFCLK